MTRWKLDVGGYEKSSALPFKMRSPHAGITTPWGALYMWLWWWSMARQKGAHGSYWALGPFEWEGR